MFKLKAPTTIFKIFSAPKLISVESLYSVTVPKSFLIARVKVAGWGALQVQISDESSAWNEKLRFFGGSMEYLIVAPVNSVMTFHVGNLFGMRQFNCVAKPNLDQYPEIQPAVSQEMVELDGLTRSIHRNSSLLPNVGIQMNLNILRFEIHNEMLKPQMMRFNNELSESTLESKTASNVTKMVIKKFQVPLLDIKKISQQLDAESELAKMPRSIQL